MNFLANNRISMFFILQNRCKIEVEGKLYILDYVRLYRRGHDMNIRNAVS